jgi:hypothetical protein
VDVVRVLERIGPVARDYGLPAGEMKPCMAAILDGIASGFDRHRAAFTLAAEFRRLGLDQRQAERLVSRWARTIGYRVRKAQRARVMLIRRSQAANGGTPRPV